MGKGARIRKERAEKRDHEPAQLKGGKSNPKPTGNQPPPWPPSGKMPPFGLAGGWPSEDPISKVMSFVSSQPQLIVCGLFGLDPITYDERRELLGGVSLYHSLETVACVQAQWDVAYSTTRGVRDVEGDFLAGGGEGGLSEKVLKRIIIYGDMLISPRATAQLQREIIEYASTDHAAPAIDRNTLTQLLLSITTEQNLNSEFAGDVPTTDEIAKLQHKLPKMGLEELHEYAKPLIQGEIASALFNAPLRLEIVLSNTYDLWFTKWAPRSKTTGLGATPAEAFKIATEVELIDIMRLGLRIIKRSTKNQQVRFSRDELLADGASEAAIDYLFTNMALKLDDFKTKLQEDRNAGEIGHQRYTLTRYPFLAINDNAFVTIRHQWALDRLCGGQLYFEAWASLPGSARHRFKTAMNDAFEQFVAGILHRIVDKCPHLLAIADEPDMQAAWTQKKGVEPSVCDWLILGKDHCVVIDATNHAVKEDAAQGLATWEAYSADVEKIFMDTDHGKYSQLLSTIDLVQKHRGWEGHKVDNKTMYAPLVIVPDAGVTNGLLAQFDINIRSVRAFKHLQPQVYAPGIVPLSDLQLLEGMANIGAKGGKNPNMMDLIAKWRTAASKYGMASLQLYLLSYGAPTLPLSDHILKNSGMVINLLNGN
ncbi:hypothetical protein U8D42_28815 (plasmid) [Mycobacterium europaeum]|uniref:Uncharacterized protein n=3 Tax=Mycobacterium TaxID=1763 RepID=A0A1X0K5V9_MYCSC|nr:MULTISPECIES: hypothetical protein [Mycobacterium]ASL12218.1 hypothetical protein MYCODSM44623_05544 [Mycobacterium intracellulare subsp. chimaera]ASL18189.1 hypothetical protein MYCOZU2_05844 [Mycobacterium intracellulare subsp. chimaera]KLO35102.1 hypothetical protein ABW17_24700 [Mycobacterium nebraskense]MCV7120447.1 hypothetical protein [Mycobacterium nebraskense]MCV7328241.1 hypothetical protein [Mycobacterium intracellulare subsp. chimaera]